MRNIYLYLQFVSNSLAIALHNANYISGYVATILYIYVKSNVSDDNLM